MASRSYVAQFNFKGPDQQRKVGELSGGERNRVHLAKLLKSGGNLLLLEAMLVEIGTGRRMPLSDLIMNAWSSAPDVIRNRADLLHSVANTYKTVRTNMEEETTSLTRGHGI